LSYIVVVFKGARRPAAATRFERAIRHSVGYRPRSDRRCVSRKATELIERGLEARKRVVDHRRQPTDLVVLVRDRESLVQAVCRDSLRF